MPQSKKKSSDSLSKVQAQKKVNHQNRLSTLKLWQHHIAALSSSSTMTTYNEEELNVIEIIGDHPH